MDNRLITLTNVDASLMCGLIWNLDRAEPLEILATGVADSPTARRLALLLAGHEDAGQPASRRLAAYRSIAQLVLQRLFEPSDAAARERRDVLTSALELGDADQAAVAELGLDAWCKTTELLAALAPLAPPAELETVMQQAAERAYAHLFAR